MADIISEFRQPSVAQHKNISIDDALPPEILVMVFKLAAENLASPNHLPDYLGFGYIPSNAPGRVHRYHPHQLGVICLVSRAWYALAAPLLYRDYFIPGPILNSSKEQATLFTRARPFLVINGADIQAGFGRVDPLWVRKVTIIGRSMDPATYEMERNMRVLMAVLSQFVNVDTVRVALDVKGGLPGALFDMIYSLPRLAHLSSFWPPSPLISKLAARPWGLKSLYISAQLGDDIALSLRELLRHSRHSLVNLHIQTAPGEFVYHRQLKGLMELFAFGADEEDIQFTALRDLMLDMGPFLRDRNPAAGAPATADWNTIKSISVDMFPCLSTLEVWPGDLPSWTSEFLLLPSLSCTKPIPTAPCLTRLSLQISSQDLLRLLEHCTAGLRELYVYIHPSMSWEVDYGLDSIVAVLTKRHKETLIKLILLQMHDSEQLTVSVSGLQLLAKGCTKLEELWTTAVFEHWPSIVSSLSTIPSLHHLRLSAPHSSNPHVFDIPDRDMCHLTLHDRQPHWPFTPGPIVSPTDGVMDDFDIALGQLIHAFCCKLPPGKTLKLRTMTFDAYVMGISYHMGGFRPRTSPARETRCYRIQPGPPSEVWCVVPEKMLRLMGYTYMPRGSLGNIYRYQYVGLNPNGATEEKVVAIQTVSERPGSKWFHDGVAAGEWCLKGFIWQERAFRGNSLHRLRRAGFGQ